MLQKVKNKNDGFTYIELFIVLIVIVAIASVAITVISKHTANQNLKNNEAYFSYLNKSVTAFDSTLKSKTGDSLSYAQNNDCYYWQRSDFGNGPLGCFINREYYFPASNEKTALNLDKEIVSAFHSTYPAPRFTYPQDDLTYSKYIYTAKGIMYVGQPAAGFYDNSGSPSLDIKDTTDKSIDGGCTYQINWPNESQYNGTNAGSNSEFPVRDNWNLLVMAFSCGANASKDYFPFNSSL